MGKALEPVNLSIPKNLVLQNNLSWDFASIAKSGPSRTSLHGRPSPIHFKEVLYSKIYKTYATKGIIIPKGEVYGWTYDVQRPETWLNNNKTTTKPVFQQFADINGDSNKVMEFARSFGLLGFSYPIKKTVSSIEDVWAEAEPLMLWIVWSKIMFRCVKLWEKISSTKTLDFAVQKEMFSEVCDITLDSETRLVTCKFSKTPGSSVISRSQDKPYHSNNVTNAATNCLLGQINPHLVTGITYHVLLDPENITVHPRLRVKSLFSYLWYDFANHVCSGREIRTCPVCHDLFVSNASEKVPRKTCSDKCRTKNMRTKTKDLNP